MEKVQYFIIGIGFAFIIIGILAGGVSGIVNNSTVENKTTLPPQNGSDNYITMPNDTIEEPQEEELSPSEQIAIREGEKAEEDAMSEDEETDISSVETSEDPIIDESTTEEIKPTLEPENKPVSTQEKTIFVKEKSKTLKKTVSASGFVFVGTEYAGEEVEITVK